MIRSHSPPPSRSRSSARAHGTSTGRAEVTALGCTGAHAGPAELLAWATATPAPETAFVAAVSAERVIRGPNRNTNLIQGEWVCKIDGDRQR